MLSDVMSDMAYLISPAGVGPLIFCFRFRARSYSWRLSCGYGGHRWLFLMRGDGRDLATQPVRPVTESEGGVAVRHEPTRRTGSAATMTPRKFIGDELGRAREAAGFKTQQALADHLGFDRTVITKAETGARVAS